MLPEEAREWHLAVREAARQAGKRDCQANATHLLRLRTLRSSPPSTARSDGSG